MQFWHFLIMALFFLAGYFARPVFPQLASLVGA